VLFVLLVVLVFLVERDLIDGYPAWVAFANCGLGVAIAKLLLWLEVKGAKVK
jgi:hypothetical protein